MSSKLAWLAALGATLWLSTAFALGLGEIEVRSKLNQRFSATIPLTSVNPEDAQGILVNLASNADFDRTGIERTDFLSSLRFALKADDGAPRIEVTSTQIAREPFVSFLVEVRSPSGRSLREYTVLLDPPYMVEAPPAAPPTAPPASVSPPASASSSSSDFYQTAEEEAGRTAPPEAPGIGEAPRSSAGEPAFEASAPAAATSQAGSYGPVQQGETFWSIAYKLRPDAPRVTMDQMLLAIYEDNRSSFDGGIHGLRKGSTLRIPPLGEILSVDAASAKSRVASLRGEPVSRPAPRAPAAEPAPAPAIVAPPPAPEPEPEPEPEPAPAPAPEKKTDEVTAPAPEVPAPSVTTEPETVTPPPAEEVPSSQTPPETTAAPETPLGQPSQAPAVDDPVAPGETATTRPSAPVRAEPAAERNWMPLLLAIAGVLLLAVLGFLAWRFVKQRRAAAPAPAPAPAAKSRVARGAPPPAPAPAPKVPPPASAKPSPKDELDELSDTLSPEPKAPPPARTQQVQTQMLATQQMTGQAAAAAAAAQLPTFDATQVMEMEAAKTAIETGGVDFDVTGQFASETVQINLDANDPMSEADFHLAYGLYDEAAMLLRGAVDKEPGRPELRVKLAETYFAGGKPAEFQETAEALKPMLSPAEWQKIAIMGQQLCPDVALFKGADAGMDVATDFDFGSEEPAMSAPAAPAPAAPAPAAPAARAAPAASGGSGLEFSLEELELPQMEAPAASAPADKGRSLEFDIGDFDLNKPAERPPTAHTTATPSAAAPAAGADEPLAFDLSQDLSATPGVGDIKLDDVKLDDFDMGDMPSDSNAIAGGDEASTKLDLARAYVDMGDNDMARSLLNEVLQQGNADQKKEAQTLVGRLS